MFIFFGITFHLNDYNYLDNLHLLWFNLYHGSIIRNKKDQYLMPYISNTRRLIQQAQPLDEIYINNPGELNYLITYLCDQYWQQSGNYQGINDIVGALEGAKMEFYRRVAAPYEDKKIIENGDVYNV